MNYFISLLILNTIYRTVYSGIGNRWTYEGELGPEHWKVDYEICGKQEQSPIDIVTSEVRLNTSIPDFNLSSYDTVNGIDQELENVGGHTAEVKYNGGLSLIITGGGLAGEYKVDQFHFHWGSANSYGSEHQMNGKPFSMEMHIVHHSTQYANLTDALDKPDGLAVLGFFFKVGETNPAFDSLLAEFGSIEHAEDKIKLDTQIKLSSLLPKNMSVFWRYHGSLTTPPCYETVIWTLFYEPIIVSEEQMSKYRSLKRNKVGEEEKDLVNDFRPLQPLNRRVVETNNELGLSSGSKKGVQIYLSLVICLQLVLLALVNRS
ncbi:carbonic anhydrase 1 isoform X3 [Patella vulgata]|uniref:carbonic anhydrase 1 isoform X3 n=1 Tax=Patella vulgata TaxID=6465 RepID=UPI0024A90050|nr:carbonic anhydrase 1 isoform X3 [Patella vulgata]